MTTERIDVLGWVREASKAIDTAYGPQAQLPREAAAVASAVAELIEAATRVNGEHNAPHDCYATGPLTGNPYTDLVECPGCRLAAALARVGAP